MTFTSKNPEIARYLEKSQAVVDSSRAVADALDSKLPVARRQMQIDVAVELLKDALSEIQEGPVARAGFASRAADAKDVSPLTLDEQLAVAAADASTACVLYAASKAVGETSDREGAGPLRAVLETVDSYAEPAPTAQRFREAIHFRSEDPEEAVAAFRAQAERSLEEVVKESAELIERIFKYLAEKATSLAEAFDFKDELLELKEQAAPLLKSAWEKFLSALKSLRDLVEQIHNDDAKKQLTEMMESASVSAAVGKVFGRAPLNRLIESFQTASCKDAKSVDGLSDQLAALVERFKRLATSIKRIEMVVAVSGSLIAAHVTGPFSVLMVPAAHSLAIMAVIVLGSDFVHQGRLNGGVGIAVLLGQFEQLSLSGRGGHDPA